MEIRSSGYKIIQSGIVSPWKTEPVEFIFSDDFIVKIGVVKDSKSEPIIKTSVVEQKILYVEFTNPHKILNFGTMEPFQIGKYNGNDVYANLRVNVIVNDDGSYSSYELSYTFYLREE